MPEKIIKDGDPYQWQVEQTVLSLVRRLNIENLDYQICYQSRVGPVKWIGPDTENEVERACKENKNIIIVPVAFVSEHVETLVELDIEYKDIADQHGISYSRVATLSTNKHYIEALANMVLNFSSAQEGVVASNFGKRLCPHKYSKCPCKITTL